MAIAHIRYLLVAIVLIIVIALYQIDRHRYSPQNINTQPKYTPQSKPDNGKWAWSERIAHYPLQSYTPLPSGRPNQLPRIQHSFGIESASEKSVRIQRQQAVKEVFKKAWKSYRERAWMHDELAPLTGTGQDFFGGWAATLIDALDTLWIMDMRDEFHEAATAAVSIDFTTSTDSTINVFETTIRYLGGFIAAYELSGDIRLLHKAVEIGEMLLVPFDTPNHFPITRWEWRKAREGGSQVAPAAVLVSEVGSLSLEFTRLSQLTQDPRWYDAINRITQMFDKQQSKTTLPGMWPVVINAQEEDTTFDTLFTLGGMSDSLYEYFPKMYALLGGLEPVYQKLYEDSVVTAEKHLFFRPMTPHGSDILVSGDLRAYVGTTQFYPKGQHLTCFVGGMLALGGQLFNNPHHLSLGKKITDGCIWAYNATSVGVMPEIEVFVPCSSKEACPWDREKWKAAVLEPTPTTNTAFSFDDYVTNRQLPEGFADIPDPRYILRPEALESVFYMYRTSGDRDYLDHAWQMFSAIQHISATDIANAAVLDITAKARDGMPPKDNRMESFWLAETLKYAYLIFSEPDLISLDDFVFNTEAHPFKLPK